MIIFFLGGTSRGGRSDTARPGLMTIGQLANTQLAQPDARRSGVPTIKNISRYAATGGR